MALKIRLRQQGCNNRQTYRVVVTDVRNKRDGKYVEKLGWYLPYLTENNCNINSERLAYWLAQGAVMSDQVESLAREVAPSVIKEFKEKKAQTNARRIAKRRSSGSSKKEAAPAAEKEVKEKAAAPKRAAKKASTKK